MATNGARANVGAAPTSWFCAKFPANGEVSVFQHARLRMSAIVSFNPFTRHDAAQYASRGNACLFRVGMGLLIDPALRIKIGRAHV